MDKNSVIGLVLITGILLGSTYFFGPSPEELEKQAQQTEQAEQSDSSVVANIDEAAYVEDAIDTSAVDTLQLQLVELLAKKTFGTFYKNSTGSAKYITVSSPKATYTLSTKGASLKEVILSDYKTYKQDDLSLFDPSSVDFNLALKTDGKDIHTNALFFDYQGENNITLAEGEEKTLVFTAGEGDDKVTYTYVFNADSYYLDFSVRHNATEASLNLFQEGFNNEKHLETERTKSSVYYREYEEKRDYLSERTEEEEVIETELHWVAFKQDFFSTAIISRQGQLKPNSKLAITPSAETDTVHTKAYAASLALQNKESNFYLYYGPNQYNNLTEKDVAEFDRIIDFGWAIFGWVNKYLILNVFLFLDGTGMSYGIIILVLTLLIKLALSPLTYKNFLSSAKMRVLKPEIEALNEKNKNADAVKKQQDTMALYRETGVNPMAGCLPMILQMPILYAMFRFFPASIELRQESFLWADDLSSFDSIMPLPFDVPFYGDHVSLFTLMLAVSTFFYSKLNMGNQAMPQQQEGMPQINMKMMTYIFPFMMLFFFNNYSSGLSYYYFLSNVISIAQMFIIKKYFVDEVKILAKIQERKKQKKGKSGFQKRMEEMAKKRGVNMPKG